MNAFALPLALMLIGILLEQVALRRWRAPAPPWRDTILNLNSGHIVMWLCRGLEVAGYTAVYTQASLHVVDRWPAWGEGVFAFVAWDLGFYVLHRLHHRWSWLWAVHVVHHEGEHFNLSLGVRNAWVSSLTSLPFFVPLAWLGVRPEVFVAVSGLHYAVQWYNHSGWVRGSGWLDRWLVTPANHRVHHGCNIEYRDRNFGGTLLCWDRWFGTYQREIPGVPIRYGVLRPTPSDNPLWANLVPLLRLARWPLPVLERNVHRVSDRWIASAGVLLFGVVIDAVRTDGRWPGHWQAVWCAVIFAQTLALGALSDGRPWARGAWAVCALALPVLMVGVLGHRGWGSVLPAVALGLQGLACCWAPAEPELNPAQDHAPTR